MSSITVAIVNIEQNQQRQTPISELLQHNATHFELLTDPPSGDIQSMERRCIARDELTFVENAVARIRRLNPQVLLMNAGQAMQECCDLLRALQDYCPSIQALVVIDEAVGEDDLLKALACGARGFIAEDLDFINFSKVVTAIDRGEPWVPRKMTARLMQQIVSASR